MKIEGLARVTSTTLSKHMKLVPKTFFSQDFRSSNSTWAMVNGRKNEQCTEMGRHLVQFFELFKL